MQPHNHLPQSLEWVPETSNIRTTFVRPYLDICVGVDSRLFRSGSRPTPGCADRQFRVNTVFDMDDPSTIGVPPEYQTALGGEIHGFAFKPIPKIVSGPITRAGQRPDRLENLDTEPAAIEPSHRIVSAPAVGQPDKFHSDIGRQNSMAHNESSDRFVNMALT